uniref:Uncharacterized protein n=1 Tax=Ditylenchus dipsaci TaxID=166011 RepID=A0A915CP55_9BILA
MEMLDTILHRKIRLIDFEKFTTSDGKRLVMFGNGQAMLDSSIFYMDLRCGYEIALNRLPRSIGPLIFVFTGSGNVSQGAQDLFKHLPHEFIDVATLPQVAKRGQLNKVYGCVVSRADHMIRKEGGVFNMHEFDEHPDRYVSTFASEVC